MSAGGIAVSSPSSEARPAHRPGRPLWDALERLSPSQGWATFALLMAILLVIGNLVIKVNWVETPGLLTVLLGAGLSGLFLAKIRAPALILHPVGLVIGAVLVVWHTSSLIENEPVIGQIRELWSRLNVWYEAATSGGISTDLIPFSMGVLAIAWIIGYLTSWFVFRSDNVWVAVVLLGITILTILSFISDKYVSWFFLFIFFAMLLVVRMTIVQGHDAWRKAQTNFSISSGWLTIHAAVWFSVLVVLLAAFLPLKAVKYRPLADIWNTARQPVVLIEDEFGRLFSGIPSRRNRSGRFFGKTLPFLGKIKLGGEVVLWAKSDFPSYWLSDTYSEYTSQGWIAGKTVPLRVGPSVIPPPRVDSLSRIRTEQSLYLDFDTSNFLSGGTLDWISEDAIVQTLLPKEFEIDLLDSSKDSQFPEDIQRLAVELREELDPPPKEAAESYISKMVPGDLVLTGVTPDGEAGRPRALETVTLTRKAPSAPDIVSRKLTNRLQKRESYTMVSHVSMATDDVLRKATTEYSGFIKDHYLQLPATLPTRVRDLAERLTVGAETPIAKALAIERYLRSPVFVYSQDIEAPPKGDDGVDYFLFETREGYSDYFGSAMAVMLRAVGVPTRMAAGYAPGVLDPETELRVVKDTDSHGWVQVYFPKYGWIDFEPTPNWPAHKREMEAESGPGVISPTMEDVFPEEFTGLEEELYGIEQALALLAEDEPWNPLSVIIPLAIALPIIVLLWLFLLLLWTFGLAKATPVERAYTKMSRLGALAGVRRRAHQTPVEYAAALSTSIPAIASAVYGIAWAFAIDRYGKLENPWHDDEELEQAWKSIRGSLVARALGRLTPAAVGLRR